MRTIIGRWGRLLTLAAAVLVAVLLQLLFVDAAHVNHTIWAAEVPLIWAALGFAATVAAAALVFAATRLGLHRDRNPYDDGGDADG